METAKTDNVMKRQYKLGQVVTLKNGFTGTVVNVKRRGNDDIREPYHSCGAPTLKGCKGWIGYFNIIPDQWPAYYAGEINEREIISVQ